MADRQSNEPSVTSVTSAASQYNINLEKQMNELKQLGIHHEHLEMFKNTLSKIRDVAAAQFDTDTTKMVSHVSSICMTSQYLPKKIKTYGKTYICPDNEDDKLFINGLKSDLTIGENPINNDPIDYSIINKIYDTESQKACQNVATILTQLGFKNVIGGKNIKLDDFKRYNNDSYIQRNEYMHICEISFRYF